MGWVKTWSSTEAALLVFYINQQFHKIFSNASIIDSFEKSKYILLSADDGVARDQTENTKLAVFPILHTVKLQVVDFLG